jgi:quercetin dioxygenase-like cupin family protein
MTINVIHWNSVTDGEPTEALMREKLELLGYSVSRYVYPPGTLFPDHTHDVDKIDGVLSGQFKMTIEGQSVVLTAGDMLVVPHGVVHSAEVLGNEPVISLDAIK